MKDNKRITIRDVARRAGVSPSTVSRVISGNPRISKETTERVLQCMEKMGYHPNAIARSLANSSSQTIGLVMPNGPGEALSNPFFPEALSGILRTSSAMSYDILLAAHLGDESDQLESIKSIINASKVDGIILMTSRCEDKSIDYLDSIDFPYSVIGSPEDGHRSFNHADNDNALAAYELTAYMISRGYNNLAILSGGRDLVVTKMRIDGFRKALYEAGIDCHEDQIRVGEFDEETGYSFGKWIAGSGNKINGVIATDDVLAFGAATALIENGIRIPEDVAVSSFNNSILSRRCNIPLTSIEINPGKLGEEAVKLVIDAIVNGERGKRVIVQHQLHKRLSTEGTDK